VEDGSLKTADTFQLSGHCPSSIGRFRLEANAAVQELVAGLGTYPTLGLLMMLTIVETLGLPTELKGWCSR
jgi:hypothetical protein